MKNLFPLLALSLMLIHPAKAIENPGSGLEGGTPIDPRCSLSVGNGVIDFGSQTKAQMQQSGRSFSPGKRTLTLSVACPVARQMKLAVQGDRGANGNLRYGSEGSVKARLFEATLDGQPVQLRDISQSEQPAKNELPLSAGSRIAVTRQGMPVMGKSLMIKLELEPEITNQAASLRSRTTSEATFSISMIN